MKIDFTEMPNSCMSSTRPTRFSNSEFEVTEGEIQKLLEKNIQPCPHEEREVILNIFLLPKKDGFHRMRLILTLKNLNQFAEYKHFKMDSLYILY